MEGFWVEVAEIGRSKGGETIVAFPSVSEVSPAVSRAPLSVVELAVPFSLDRSFLSLKSFITGNRIRTVYLTDRRYHSLAYALLRNWGVKSIILHDQTPGEQRHPGKWRLMAKRAMHGSGLTSADHYIGASKFVHDRFIEVNGIAEERCSFVRNGIRPYLGAEKDIRAELGIPANSRVVVSCSRASPYKQVDFIIRIADRLITELRNPRLHFVHIGDGPAMQELRAMVENLGLKGKFIFAGQRSDVRALLPSCTLAIHASRGEAFSFAILEFMASGIPSIVPDNCGNGEAIEHGVTGALYDPGDLDTAVAWTHRLLDEPHVARKMGAAAAERASTHFTLDGMNQRFREIITPHIRV